MEIILNCEERIKTFLDSNLYLLRRLILFEYLESFSNEIICNSLKEEQMFAKCLISAFLKRKDISIYREFIKTPLLLNSTKLHWIEDNIIVEEIFSHFNPKFNFSPKSHTKKFSSVLLKNILNFTSSSNTLDNSNSEKSEKTLNQAKLMRKRKKINEDEEAKSTSKQFLDIYSRQYL